MTGDLTLTVLFGDAKDTWVITSSIYVVVDSIEGSNGQNDETAPAHNARH
jgi:hypothetical protein